MSLLSPGLPKTKVVLRSPLPPPIPVPLPAPVYPSIPLKPAKPSANKVVSLAKFLGRQAEGVAKTNLGIAKDLYEGLSAGARFGAGITEGFQERAKGSLAGQTLAQKIPGLRTEDFSKEGRFNPVPEVTGVGVGTGKMLGSFAGFLSPEEASDPLISMYIAGPALGAAGQTFNAGRVALGAGAMKAGTAVAKVVDDFAPLARRLATSEAGAARMPGISNSSAPQRNIQAGLRPFADIKAEVADIKNPVLRNLAGRLSVNPAVVHNTEAGKNITAYTRQLINVENQTDAIVSTALDKYAQVGTGRSILGINGDGFMQGTGKQWYDVVSKPANFKLQPDQQAFAKDFTDTVSSLENLRVAGGLEPRVFTLPSGEFYVPRQVKGVRGIEFDRPSSPNLQRLYDEATEGFAAGVSYDNNPRAVLEIYTRSTLKEIADKQFMDEMAKISVAPRQLIPPAIRDRFDKAEAVYLKAKNEVERLTVPNVGKPAPELRAEASKLRQQAQQAFAKAKPEYFEAKDAYSAAMESAMKAEKAPGYLFNRTEAEIPVAKWRNTFLPRDEAKLAQKLVGEYGVKGAETAPHALAVQQVVNAMRTSASLGDLATGQVQGAYLLVTNPLKWAEAQYSAMEAFVNPRSMANFNKRHASALEFMSRHEIPIGDVEFFAAMEKGKGISLSGNTANKIAEAVPGLEGARTVGRETFKQTGGRFAAHYGQLLKAMRVYTIEAKQPSWGGTEAELAQYVRNLSGGLDSRAIGVGPTQRNVEAFWMAFSPRLMRSTIAITADAMKAVGKTLLGQSTSQAERESAKALGSLITAITAGYIATGVALGKTDDEIKQGLNPLSSSKFLSHEIGGIYYGVGGQTRSLAQLMAGIVSAAAPGGKPIEDLARLDRFDNPLFRYVTGRGAPGAATVHRAAEAASGGDWNADPYNKIDGWQDFFKATGSSSAPFAAQAWLEGQGAIATTASFVGANTNIVRPDLTKYYDAVSQVGAVKANPELAALYHDYQAALRADRGDSKSTAEKDWTEKHGIVAAKQVRELQKTVEAYQTAMRLSDPELDFALWNTAGTPPVSQKGKMAVAQIEPFAIFKDMSDRQEGLLKSISITSLEQFARLSPSLISQATGASALEVSRWQNEAKRVIGAPK